MKNQIPFFISILVLFLISSCANFHQHLSKSEQDWQQRQLPSNDNPIKHTVFLIGDAGNSPIDGSTPALSLLKKHLNKANKNSHVIFLGDNIYPVGMPPKDADTRAISEHRLDAQLATLENFKGKPIFLPGNHDWYKYGLKGVRRQEKYIEKFLNKGIEDEHDWNEDYFLPNDGCSGPDVIEVNNQLVIIVIDSNWFVIDWDKHPHINDGCDISSRDGFKRAFDAVIRKNKSKNILVALHHPLISNGKHGGHYSVRSHIFPIPGKGKNIPVPILGTVANGLRSAIGARQDITHSIYQQLITNLITPASSSGEFIFASGHDHNLQYFDSSNSPTNGQHFIVSGTGSKKTPAVGGNQSKFVHAEYGFSKLDYYSDGSVWLEFWITTKDGKGELAYRTEVKGEFEHKEISPGKFATYEAHPATYNKKPILTPVEDVNKIHDKILGRHYRDVYLENYDFKTLDLNTFKGGLDIIKKGGGMQTNSLRLSDPTGQQYVLRSFTKDETRGVPYPFNRMSFVSFILRDNYLSTHPFGCLPVPTLADACNVFHANPEIYYVPKQPKLGVHNDIFGDEVYIFEERAGGNWKDLASFGNSHKIISTIDVAHKIQKNHKHQIDEKWVARSRLFDLMIGDWDRHDDQWRWAISKDHHGHKIYRPIPRDRDQAFSKYDGSLIQILRPLSPFLRQISDYKEELNNMKWAANNTRHFDHAFLTELTLEDWLVEASFIKTNLTNAIIDEAFTHFPDKAGELSAERIKEVLRYRRDHIEEIATAFYHQLSKKVAIVGTNKKELFIVSRKDNQTTNVKMYNLKKGKKDHLIYERDFVNADTKEIFLYGLEDDDEFYLEGEVSKSIVVRIVGGAGKDIIVDKSKVSGFGHKTKVYDSIGKNKIDLGTEAKDKTNHISTNNFYDRKGSQFDEAINLPIPILGVTADDGFLVGFKLTRTEYGFNTAPYGKRHHYEIDYATATNGVSLIYNGEYIQAAGKWDIVLNTDLQTGRYAFNFYGLGNDTQETNQDLDFNRVRRTRLYLDAGFQRRFAGNYGRFSIRPLIQFNDIEETENRFITDDANGLSEDVFDSNIHTGALTHLVYENVDDLISPKKGIKFEADFSLQLNLDDTNRNFNSLNAAFTFYRSTNNKSPLTLATQLGTSKIVGAYPFHFAPSLGQQNSLRGFRPERFRGETSFYHTTDLRWTLFSSRNVVVPFSFGIFGGFDYGRVWEKELNSNTWHNSYGGGAWIAPIDFIILSFGIHHSDEHNLFRFKVGHDF